jgi:hypothetical protein
MFGDGRRDVVVEGICKLNIYNRSLLEGRVKGTPGSLKAPPKKVGFRM